MSKNANAAAAAQSSDMLEIDQMAEAELDRLQKQLRKMEKEHKAFQDEKRSVASKRERIIETLTKEKDTLQHRLDAIQEGPHARHDAKIDTKIEQMLQRKESINRSMDEQKTSLWELEGHIKKVEKQIANLKQNQSTEKLYNEEMGKVQKSIHKLENQLDVVNKRCGEVTTENAALREHIDHLLLERARFNDMWQKMVTKLEQGKKYVMELVETSVAAYDQREDICNKIQNLDDRGKMENNVHMQEMREMQRKLDHDAKLQEFFGVKGNRRVNAELEMREANRKLMQQEQVERQLNDLESILDDIKHLAGEEELDKLARYFTKQEEENFALFNYVNELSYEVEVLHETVQQIQDDIDKQKIENEAKRQTQRESTIDVLEENFRKATIKASAAEEIHVGYETELREMLTGIENIFSLLKCGRAPILNLLASQATQKGISIYNVKLFLGVIKRQTNQVINNLSCIDQPCRILGKRDRVPKFNIKDVSSPRS